MTHLRTLFILLFLILVPFNSEGNTKYVSINGSNENSGSKEHPFGTLDFAVNQDTYDTLIILQGTYSIDAPVVFKRSGTAEAPLVINGDSAGQVIIDASDYVTEPVSGKTPQRSGIASLHLPDVHHIRIYDLEVHNSHGMGISLAHKSSDIILQRCKVVNSYNSGIGLWYSDHVKVLHCEIIGANRQDMATSKDRLGHEAPHEALTIAGATHFEVAFNEVHHCDKEGIDCKEVSSHGIVHHNYMHDLPRQGLYVDCWFGLLEDVEFSHNRVHDCEWGMAISGEGKDASMRNIRIHHNLIYDNRGSGIYFGVWGHDVLRDSIFIYNNTILDNGSKAHWAGPVGGIDIRSKNIQNVYIYNNIVSGNHSFELGSSYPDDQRAKAFRERSVIVTHNHTGYFKSIPDPPGAYGSVYGFAGKLSSEGDPGIQDKRDARPETWSNANRPGWKDAPFAVISYIGAISPN